MPRSIAAALARASSRDAIATMSVKAPACMAGMTCFAAIWAVLKTPHLTFFDTDHEPLQRMKKRSGVVAARCEAKWRPDGWMQLGKWIGRSSETTVVLACGLMVVD